MKPILIVLCILSTTVYSCYRASPHNTLVKTELYFGLSNKNGLIADSTWTRFRKQKIEAVLNGYTEIKGYGFWRDLYSNSIYEPSVIVIYIHEQSDSESIKIDSLINLYKKEFDQESVLKVDCEVTTHF
jgi:hypothetical protein